MTTKKFDTFSSYNNNKSTKYFGFSTKKMYARISFTDFNGDEFMKNLPSNLKIDDKLLNKFAPKIVKGTKRLKAWVEST